MVPWHDISWHGMSWHAMACHDKNMSKNIEKTSFDCDLANRAAVDVTALAAAVTLTWCLGCVDPWTRRQKTLVFQGGRNGDAAETGAFLIWTSKKHWLFKAEDTEMLLTLVLSCHEYVKKAQKTKANCDPFTDWVFRCAKTKVTIPRRLLSLHWRVDWTQ